MFLRPRSSRTSTRTLRQIISKEELTPAYKSVILVCRVTKGTTPPPVWYRNVLFLKELVPFTQLIGGASTKLTNASLNPPVMDPRAQRGKKNDRAKEQGFVLLHALGHVWHVGHCEENRATQDRPCAPMRPRLTGQC